MVLKHEEDVINFSVLVDVELELGKRPRSSHARHDDGRALEVHRVHLDKLHGGKISDSRHVE